MVLFRRLLCGVRCVEMFVLQCGTVCCIVLHCVGCGDDSWIVLSGDSCVE